MKGSVYASDLIKLVFQATGIANIADNAASSPLTNLYLSLHSADPGAAGTQTTSEANYTSYVRVAVARSSSGWDVSGAVANLHTLTSFPACTGSGQTLTHWGVGTASSGTGKLLYSGPVGSSKGAGTALASTDVITTPGYSPTDTDRVSFEATTGGSFPSGLAAGTVYFAVSSSGNTLKVSTSSGGSAVDITGNGDVLVFLHTPFVVTSSPSYTPQLTTGSTVTEG